MNMALPHTPPHRLPVATPLLLMALTAAIITFYWLFMHIGPPYGRSNAYQLLAEGFLQGHTYVNLEPAPGLAHLADPYEAQANKPMRVQDFSYYKGKFYLYFGPVPAFLWIALKWLTGYAVNDVVLTTLFASFGTAFLSLLVYRVAICLRADDTAGLAIVFAVLGLGTTLPFLLHEAFFYETAIAGAYCFSAAGLCCLWRYLERGRTGWLALMSLCFGLATGCRITHAASMLAPAAALIYFFFYRRDLLRFSTLLAMAAPFASCVAGLMTYNYVRFGSVAESGAHYVLTILGNMHDPAFRLMEFNLRAVIDRLYFYLLHPLPWTSDHRFPFFAPGAHQSSWLTTAKPHWYLEPLYGLITNSPFCIFFLLYLCNWTATRQWHMPARILCAGLTAYSAGIFSFLLVYFFYSERYQVDYAPWVMAVSGIYYLHLLKACASRRKYYLLLCIGGALAGYSLFTGIMSGYCSYSRCAGAAL